MLVRSTLGLTADTLAGEKLHMPRETRMLASRVFSGNKSHLREDEKKEIIRIGRYVSILV